MRNKSALLLCLGVLGAVLAAPRDAWAGDPVPPPPPPGPVLLSVGGLRGVDRVGVVVEDLTEDAATRTFLTRDELETTLTAALMRSGTVRVDTPRQAGSPYVYLNVNLLPLRNVGASVFNVKLEFAQTVYVIRPGVGLLAVLGAKTWSREFVGVWPDNGVSEKLKGTIRDLVDAFTVAYHEDNPQPLKPPGQPPG